MLRRALLMPATLYLVYVCALISRAYVLVAAFRRVNAQVGFPCRALSRVERVRVTEIGRCWADPRSLQEVTRLAE